MAALRSTRALLAARTAFQEFGMMPQKRDPDYLKFRHKVSSYKDMHSGYLFPMSTFQWFQPNELRAGEPSALHWYTVKGMSSKAETKSKYREWYRRALGQVQYMDGFEYPELQAPEDLLEPEALGGLTEPIPLLATGKGREFALKVEELRKKEKRERKDVEHLIAEYGIWTEGGDESRQGGEQDVLANQPASLFEALLVMCAQHQDWVNVTALLREMGNRGVPLRSVAAAALFEFVTSSQTCLSLFEVLKKESVRLHLHTYYALIRALERIDTKEMGVSLNAQWHETGEATGDMVDFIISGADDSLFPETAPYLSRIHNSDPKVEVERALSDLLRTDRELMKA